MDAGGNAYFTQSNGASGSSIIVVPAGSNVCTNSGCSNAYTLTNQLSTGYTSNPSLGVAITGTGNLYFAGSYPNSISSVTVSEFSFGSEAVGTTSGATTMVAFPTTYTVFDHFSVTGPFAVSSTTCNKGQTYFQYSSPQFCSVSVTYTATAPGPQTGTIQEYDQYGNRLGVATLSGTGLAPTINVDPGTVSAIGSGWTAPNAIAVDNAGNTYVADYTTGKVYKNASSNAIASGFVHPSALAVDSAGDLFVGDAGNSRIVELPYNIATTSYGTAVVLTTGLSGVSGLALDSSGNLYVADSGHSRVLLLSTAAGQPLGSLPSTLGSGFTTPVALAIDNAQNLYISDSGSNKVFQYSIANGTQATILSGLTKAAGVSVDATGGLFAVDSGAKTIVHVPNVSGVLNKNNAVSIRTIVATPNAIATDSFGNLYVADTADATVGEMNRSTGVLPFGNEEIQLASSSTSAIVSNGGTQAVTLGSPYYTATYSPSNSSGTFALQNSSTCANGTALSAGSACSITATFTPPSTGPYSETLTLVSNPATTATLQFTGTGVNLPKTTTTISSISPTSPSYGQTVTVTATVAPVVAGTQPTGTVSFSVDSVPQVPAVALNGSTASIQLTGLTGGSHTITASYSGSSTYAPSASTAYNLTIGKSSTTTAASILISTVYTNPTSQVPGTGVTFNVTVTPGLPGTPTGTITLYTTGSTTALGSGPLTPNGTAAITLSTLQLGQYNIYAVYSGDPNYSGSNSSPTLPLLISNPTIQITSSATSITGGGAAVTLTAYSIAGYGTSGTTTGALDLGCTGLPAYAVCSFSPPVAQVNSTTPATILLSVAINQPPAIAVPAGIGGTGGGHGGFALLLSGLLLLPVALAALGLRRGNRRLTGLLGRGRIALLAVLLLAGCTAAFSGCGGSLNGSYNTPSGTSTIGVTGTISNGTVNPAPAVTLPLQLIVP